MVSKSKAALFVLSAVVGISELAFAQGQVPEAPQPLSRIVEPITDTKLVLLRGNVRPEIRLGTDLGSVDPQLPMHRMLLVLKRSPEQETALAEFNARQLDPSSPDFHHWLTPEEFGALFGTSDSDIEAVTIWLENQGFTVGNVSKGHIFIEFSGTADLVQQTFHTEIHRYLVQGEEHIANSTDPSIPEALSSVVAGIVSLNNFYARTLHQDWGTFRRDSKTGKWTPENINNVTQPFFGVPLSGGGTFELVSPYDFATIYNVMPLWNAGIDGTGQTIAIAGRSDINLTDVANFRSAFGLPARAPTVIVNGTDPGIPSANDKTENTLDVEWSGAVAKGATIKFVTTAGTTTSDGAFSSALYIVDNNVAPIMSFSYGTCELVFGAAGNGAINSLWQQGATQGITIFVASGDQGSAACDGGGTPPYGATHGLAVSGTSTTPYNVAVGGTDLNWINSSTSYWNASNATNDSSAKGYMPEVAWNATCVSDAVDELVGGTALGFDEEQTCQALLNDNLDLGLITVAGGTGGVSACTTPSGTTPATCSGGYAKPSWQTGTGVPADGKRDVPDLSLFASAGTLNSAYAICDSDTAPCTYSNGNDALMNSVGGTSAASPAMAGIMALVNQKMGSAQGNANAGFYALAARDTRSSCNSVSVGNGNACNFYDITTDNNAVPCIPGSPNCTVHHTGDAVGIINGYKSTVGYDLATGLGSVNANNLVNNWHLVVTTQQKPGATTSAASSITATTATIAGSVNPNGADTHMVFAYGTSSTLSGASQTTSVDLGSGTSAVGVSANLTNLTAGTKYYYQVQATNSAGTANGAINSFTTLTAVTKPTATTGIASSISATTATIAGTVNPNGADTHMVFAYGTSSTLSGASKTTSVDLGSGTSAVGVSANLTALTAGTKYYYQVQATNSAGTINGVISSFTTSTAPPPSGLQFIPITPCRVADTRNPSGPFGGPEIGAKGSREFDIPQSACGIPSTAVAYSLNVTVVPSGPLGYLTLWPSGQAQPLTSTLNSLDGRVKANAAIVPAGTHGGVSVYVTDATHVILDINGYFVPEGTASALAFYPVTPCRVVDTRGASSPLGGPFIAAKSSRNFPVQSSSCGIPTSASAYSLNVTAVPHTTLGYLTTWPTGKAQPLVSTLNSYNGQVEANAAIVPAGSSGAVSVYVSDDTDVVLDINGYFASPGTGGLSLHTVAPCRALDTRNGAGAFSGVLKVDLETSPCAPPSTAKAYVLNATVVPSHTLGYLTLWPDGETQPFVSTLNSLDGAITSNMAVMPTLNGSIDAYATDSSNLILDISSYFAQCATCTETGWTGQVVCAKTVTGPNYRNNETQTWTVVPGIPQQPTGQTLYPTQWLSTGSGATATQTWTTNASGTGQLTVFANQAGINFARYNSEIVVNGAIQATPPPSYADYEYQWLAFGNSDPNALHVQGSSTTTSPTCDSPVEPGGSSCTVACSWNFNKQ
jgi:subtilase family serine protease